MYGQRCAGRLANFVDFSAPLRISQQLSQAFTSLWVGSANMCVIFPPLASFGGFCHHVGKRSDLEGVGTSRVHGARWLFALGRKYDGTIHRATESRPSRAASPAD